MKRLLFCLLFILLFSSCSVKTDSIGVWSEEGAVVYTTRDDGGKIVIEKELMPILLMDGEEIEDIFPGVEMYRLSSSEWRQRDFVISSLLSVTDKESVEESYEKENKALRKSKWEENMASISNGFDQRLLTYIRKNGGDYYLYSAQSAIGNTPIDPNEERIKASLKKWIKAIV